MLLILESTRIHVALAGGGGWRDPLDWYVDDPRLSAALFTVESFTGHVVDPCCGRGAIVLSARTAGLPAFGFDVVQRRHGRWPGADEIRDAFADDEPLDNVVSNPPYGRADEFVDAMLARTSGKVAALLPLRWLASAQRAARVRACPLSRIYVLTPRPSLPPGELVRLGLVKATGGKVDFGWFVWDRSAEVRDDGAALVHWLPWKTKGADPLAGSAPSLPEA